VQFVGDGITGGVADKLQVNLFSSAPVLSMQVQTIPVQFDVTVVEHAVDETVTFESLTALWAADVIPVLSPGWYDAYWTPARAAL
jgi:hypothetical protein